MSQDVLIERLFQLLVSGDRTGTSRLIADAMRQGLTAQTLARDAYTPLLRMINALHRAEQLTQMAHAHATDLLDSLLEQDAAGSGPAQREPACRGADQDWFGGGVCAVARHEPAGRPGDLAHKAGCRVPHRDTHESRHVRFSVSEGVLTARLVGPAVGGREAPIIGTEITDVIRAMGLRLHRLVLDLSDVRVMSSMVLGMCLDLRGYAKAYGARTVVTGVSGEMAPVFRRLNLTPRSARRGVGRLFGRIAAVS